MHSTPFGRCQPKPERGLINVIRSRFLSFSMVLGVGFYRVPVTSAASATVNFFGHLLPPGLDFSGRW